MLILGLSKWKNYFETSFIALYRFKFFQKNIFKYINVEIGDDEKNLT